MIKTEIFGVPPKNTSLPEIIMPGETIFDVKGAPCDECERTVAVNTLVKCPLCEASLCQECWVDHDDREHTP